MMGKLYSGGSFISHIHERLRALKHDVRKHEVSHAHAALPVQFSFINVCALAVS